jgi:hypothetical protein
MHNISCVKEVHCTKEIVHNRYNMLLCERVVLNSSEDATKILVEVLHDNENVIEVAISVLCLLRRNDDVHQLGSE